jgi:hypothetical protein
LKGVGTENGVIAFDLQHRGTAAHAAKIADRTSIRADAAAPANCRAIWSPASGNLALASGDHLPGFV